jgi:hypothetical protein
MSAHSEQGRTKMTKELWKRYAIAELMKGVSPLDYDP